MSDYPKMPLDTDSPEFQGSVAQGILGSIIGMAVCVLVLLRCWMVLPSVSWPPLQVCCLCHCRRLHHADLSALDASAGGDPFER